MSNYTIAIAWNGKDALSDSDPAKVISGDDFHTEFSAIQTATNSKAELNGSATESFSATTAVSGTNTTQVATTAFVKTALALVYPVGAIFTSTVAYANSAAVVTAIGGTTWVAFGAGKVLVGVDSADTDFDAVEETGGSKTHTLTTAQMPAHSHKYAGGEYSGSYDYGTNMSVNNLGERTDGGTKNFDTQSIGGGSSHPIVQPYITVYMWKRTA
jgi:hypothetical protein